MVQPVGAVGVVGGQVDGGPAAGVPPEPDECLVRGPGVAGHAVDDRLEHERLGERGVAGEQEVRAWTIHQGDTAPAAAGVIHTDFERGFIRGETVGYDDFVSNEGWKGSREKGLARAEGKEYVVKDGDVMLFRFNV